MQNIAAAVVVYELTGSALAVGVVSTIQFGGPVLLAIYAGNLVDRTDRRRLRMGARCVAALGGAWLAVYVLSGWAAQLGWVWPIYAGVAVLGISLGFTSPAINALVPSLVRPEQLASAIALSASTGNIARAVGPALGAISMLVGGPGWAFVFAAAGHLAFVALLASIRDGVPRRKARAKVDGSALAGLRYLRESPTTAWLLVAATALGIGMDPIITLAPAIVAQLGGTAALVGGLTSAFGAGAVIATVSVSTVNRVINLRRLGVLGLLMLSGGLTTVAFAPAIPGALVGFALAGAGFLFGTTAFMTRIQRRLPDEIRGRVMALWTVAFVGSRPVGALLNGGIADLTSIRTALLIGASIALLATALATRRFPSG